MSEINECIRHLCFCVIVEKGSWTPNQNKLRAAQGALKSPVKHINHNSVEHRVNVKSKKKSKDEKPEWLKQWTISKGWMHNRSHLLSLGKNVGKSKSGKKMFENSEDSDSSSVSSENIEELLSLTSNRVETHIQKEVTVIEKTVEDVNKIEVISEDDLEYESVARKNDRRDEKMKDFTLLFHQMKTNYRRNFPDNCVKYPTDLELPEIYKERMLLSKSGKNLFSEIWKQFKPRRKVKVGKNCKFTVNQLYSNNDDRKQTDSSKSYMSTLSTLGKSCDRNIEELYVDVNQIRANKHKNNFLRNNYNLNSRTNLLEDTIYECSEPNSINEKEIKYFDFSSNHLYKTNGFSFDNLSMQDKNYLQICRNNDFTNQRIKREKYVIRHIKLRIMLSLRIGSIQRENSNSRFKFFHRIFCHKSRLKRNSCGDRKLTEEEESLKKTISWVHDEQRRIGNGKTSIKIQNLRYGRLNVLRWLLWENEECHEKSDDKMPALEAVNGHGGNGTTLALHYAAARGCLDCVRLLVDTSPELCANTQMDNDVTPVYLAAQEGHLDVLKFLVLEAGGSLYVRAKDGMAPIHAASQMGCLNCVKWMIQEQGVDPNLRDGDGATPLHFAASRGHLETVRWLLKHGARLSLDKYGKSPINDAAENQQVECLNVLVQHGTTPDYKDNDKTTSKHPCSCTRRNNDRVKRGGSIISDCSNCQKSSSNSEPFYLHPPLNPRSIEAPHAPQDGLYINPMNNHRHSASSSSESSSSGSINGESFYLHNPQEVIYNRVKDLFESPSQRQPLSALTVKVEVHSSSSGAGSDENLSSSDLSERSGEHENDYEDIYLVHPHRDPKPATVRSRSRDSGSHSRSGSASSSPSHVQSGKGGKGSGESGMSTMSEEEHSGGKKKVTGRLSVPIGTVSTTTTVSKPLKRVTSVPLDLTPPPPPPPPPGNGTPTVPRQTPAAPRQQPVDQEDEPRGAEIVEIVEEPVLRPSDIMKGQCRTMAALTAHRLNSSCSDLTIVSLTETSEDSSENRGPNLVNKQRVLPFVPPSFPDNTSNSNNLIKPSEYLRSISDKKSTLSSRRNSVCEEATTTIKVAEETTEKAPPPPPLPAQMPDISAEKLVTPEVATDTVKKQQQPLSAISIQDLNSVQLRRTDKMVASKTLSAPTRSMSLQSLQGEPFNLQKTDLIAELKLSKDITGIKKLKIERAKVEEYKEKEYYSEITKQITPNKFVEQIPDKDNTGNIIPIWKRQMLAKKAAEKARKELEEQLQREAEEKRLQAIPQWKRQLIAKKEEQESKYRQILYTPKVSDEPKIRNLDINGFITQSYEEIKHNEDINNNGNNSDCLALSTTGSDQNDDSDEEQQKIIPWRAQLRKTNSKLNLLD